MYWIGQVYIKINQSPGVNSSPNSSFCLASNWWSRTVNSSPEFIPPKAARTPWVCQCNQKPSVSVIQSQQEKRLAKFPSPWFLEPLDCIMLVIHSSFFRTTSIDIQILAVQAFFQCLVSKSESTLVSAKAIVPIYRDATGGIIFSDSSFEKANNTSISLCDTILYSFRICEVIETSQILAQVVVRRNPQTSSKFLRAAKMREV